MFAKLQKLREITRNYKKLDRVSSANKVKCNYMIRTCKGDRIDDDRKRICDPGLRQWRKKDISADQRDDTSVA